MREASVRILGPLEVWVDGSRVELGGGRQRALLAILALRANEVLSRDMLVEGVWGDRPPPTAHKALQNAVSELRAVFGSAGADLILTQAPGYVLRLDGDALDARRFERLVAEGRHELEENPRRAAKLLRDALALWRGEALADFAYDGFAQHEILRLEELRLAALEDRIHADLALGRHAELVPDLEPLVAAHPLRDRLRGQLMVALYRSGRQADALEVFRQGRAILHEELGLEPSAGLRELERAILRQDESLGPAPGLPPAPLRKRRRRLAVAGVAGLLLLAALLAVALLVRDGANPAVVPDSLVKIDPATNKIVDGFPVGETPGPPAVVGGYVFVASEAEGALYRVDMRSGKVTASGRFDASGLGIAGEGDSRLWVASAGRANAGRATVARVDAASLASFDRIRLPRYSEPFAIAVGGGSLWVSEQSPPAVSRWSLRTLRLERRYRLEADSAPYAIGFGDGIAWVAEPGHNRLLRIDARSGHLGRIAVGDAPVSPVVAFGSVWVQMFYSRTVWRIDPDSGRSQAIIPVPEAPQGVAAGAGAVWVGGHCDGVLSRIDPSTNSVVKTIVTGNFPRMPAVGGGFVWIGVAGKLSSSHARC